MKKQHPSHVCNGACQHTCGEVGGVTATGQPCGRKGGWGIPGVRNGSLRLCKDHDPTLHGPRGIPAGMTDLEWRFVVEYCGAANCNATEAAARAGYTGDRRALAVTGHNLRKSPKIRAAIERRLEELSAPATEVLKRITDFARANAARLIRFDSRGSPYVHLDPETLEEVGPLIREIETDRETGVVTRVKLHDALAANRDLAKIRQLFTDAPTVNLAVSLQSMTDEQLTAEMERLRSRLTGGGGATPVSNGGRQS